MANQVQRTIAIVAGVVVVASVIGWRSLRGGVAPKASVAAAPSVPSVPSPDLAALMPYATPLPDSVVTVLVQADSVPLRRDPFGDGAVRPAAHARGGTRRSADAAGTDWHVTATLIAGARRAAVINDVLVYEGDAIPGGGKLTSVERDRVVVTDPHGTTHTVTVKEGDG
ncbi:MAG TPA: hypothetical protein VHB25_00280 [Gemmatimonadaceae bacterium]|nr:hypothetical protein [Gemmatimonadaceae bacterium]